MKNELSTHSLHAEVNALDIKLVDQLKRPTVIELFAGAGGLALGFEQAGFSHALLVEKNKNCCHTLKLNRPQWPVVKKDIKQCDFKVYQDSIDVIAGGFPCQPFSILGNEKGFDDKRGQLFFDYLRAVEEVKPKLFVAENVKGLMTHDEGRTLAAMINSFEVIGYRVQVRILKAADYKVPQKRERLFIVGVRSDLPVVFEFPSPGDERHTVRDALKKGKLFSCDAPLSVGATFSTEKKAILQLIPEGGNWRDLPTELQKHYLGKHYRNGSNAQVARRLTWEKPCFTLLTKPDSFRTERCHPEETRPLTVREYARIQTFPDDWEFVGALSSKYRQIGNAVPVNLAFHMAQAITKTLAQA